MRAETIVPARDRSLPNFASWILSFTVTMLLAFGFTMMLSTAFKFGFEFQNVLLWTFISALIITIVHLIDNKIVSIIALALPPVLFVLMLIFDIFQCRQGAIEFLSYAQTYIIYVLPGNYGEPGKSNDLILTFLALYNLIPISITAFTMTRRKLIPLSLLFYAPEFFFSVANVIMTPEQVPCICAATGILLLVLAHAFRHKIRKTADRTILILMIPSFLAALVIGLIFPMKNYSQDQIARDILKSTRNIIRITISSDNPIYEMLDTAENGLQDPDSIVELISAKQLVALYASEKDLTKVGPFNPGEGQVMGIYKKSNESYDNTFAKYENYSLYLKVESLDKYENNRLTHTRINVPVYKEDIDPSCYASGQYSITVDTLVDSSTDITPLYSDMYITPDAEVSMTALYNITNEKQNTFASYTIPVKGDFYTDEYLEKYVYGTCLEVPERTRDALTLSQALPDWYLDCLYGRSDMSDCDKIRAVTSYVSYLHPYDKDTEYTPEGVDFVPWFVTEADTGICVHYATTTVILLRMIGIPARYCTGFSYSRCYPNTQSLVYNADAHAWFEFFVPGYGWIMGDSTPGLAFRASAFNIEAVSAAYPEIEDLSFSRPRTRATDIGGNSTPTPTPVETSASDETEPSDETMESTETTEDPEDPGTSETSMPTNESGETVPASSSMPASSDPSSSDAGTVESTEEDSVDWDAVFEVLENVLKALGTMLIFAVVLFLARFSYATYWNVQFSVKNAGEKIVAYYHYYSFMHRLLKKRMPSPAVEIVDKVAFSHEKITRNDLNSFIRLSSKSLGMLSGRLPKYKQFFFSLLQIEIKPYK